MKPTAPCSTATRRCRARISFPGPRRGRCRASGLIEFASHSYDLHRGVQANPQGNITPAAVTWRYDPRTRTYEDDAQYIARIRADLIHSRTMMEANLGHPPRAIVWPYGRYTGPALQVAKELGFAFSMNLEPEPAYTSDLDAIQRYFPTDTPEPRGHRAESALRAAAPAYAAHCLSDTRRAGRRRQRSAAG